MTIDRTIFPTFRDQTAQTRYPFTDDSLLTTADGRHSLPDTLFVDGSLYMAGTVGKIGLSRIVVTTQRLTLWLGDEANTDLASGTTAPLSTAASTIEFTDNLGRSVGVLVVDPEKLPVFRGWLPDSYTFESGAAEFVATVLHLLPAVGVTGLINDLGQLLTGDAWLVGANGIVLRGDGDNIRIDIVGDPLFRRSLCSPKNLFTTPRFVTTINQCQPGPGGNIQLIVGHQDSPDAVARIYPADGGLRIEAAGALFGTAGV